METKYHVTLDDVRAYLRSFEDDHHLVAKAWSAIDGLPSRSAFSKYCSWTNTDAYVFVVCGETRGWIVPWAHEDHEKHPITFDADILPYAERFNQAFEHLTNEWIEVGEVRKVLPELFEWKEKTHE